MERSSVEQTRQNARVRRSPVLDFFPRASVPTLAKAGPYQPEFSTPTIYFIAFLQSSQFNRRFGLLVPPAGDSRAKPASRAALAAVNKK